MLEKKNEILSEEDEDYLKKDEPIKGEVKVKKPRSEAQIKAFEKTRERRRLKLLEKAEAKKKALAETPEKKPTKPKPKAKPKKKVEVKEPEIEEEEEQSEEEVITRKIIKKKKKPKKKIIEEIIYQSATESEEEDMDYSSKPYYGKKQIETNIPNNLPNVITHPPPKNNKFIWA